MGVDDYRNVTIHYGRIPKQSSSYRMADVRAGVYWANAKNSTEILRAIENEDAKWWHYDFGKHTHAIHQAMLQKAVSFKGQKPPKEIPYFKSLVEATKELDSLPKNNLVEGNSK